VSKRGVRAIAKTQKVSKGLASVLQAFAKLFAHSKINTLNLIRLTPLSYSMIKALCSKKKTTRTTISS